MAKTKQTAQNRSPRKTSNGTQKDAIALLKADHRQVEEWFGEFEKAKDGKRKVALAKQICNALMVHAQIEEEIFYPAAREVEDAESLLNEAEVEHSTAKDLIATLDEMDANEEMFSATFTVLSEYIKHHVKEEEGELFPKVKKSGLDLDALGQELAARAEDLMATQATA